VTSENLDAEQQLYRRWAAYRAQMARREAAESGDDRAAAGLALPGLPEVTVLEALEINRRLAAVLMSQRRDAVVAARAKGFSWLEIGTALGTSKQRAHARYRPQIPSPDTAACALPPVRGARSVPGEDGGGARVDLDSG